MTLPIERINSLRNTYDFLRKIATPGQFKIPTEVRKLARNCLKHYPWEYHLEIAEEKCRCGVFKECKRKS